VVLTLFRSTSSKMSLVSENRMTGIKGSATEAVESTFEPNRVCCRFISVFELDSFISKRTRMQPVITASQQLTTDTGDLIPITEVTA
jgi:hypothetical protein